MGNYLNSSNNNKENKLLEIYKKIHDDEIEEHKNDSEYLLNILIIEWYYLIKDIDTFKKNIFKQKLLIKYLSEHVDPELQNAYNLIIDLVKMYKNDNNYYDEEIIDEQLYTMILTVNLFLHQIYIQKKYSNKIIFNLLKKTDKITLTYYETYTKK